MYDTDYTLDEISALDFIKIAAGQADEAERKRKRRRRLMIGAGLAAAAIPAGLYALGPKDAKGLERLKGGGARIGEAIKGVFRRGGGGGEGANAG